ncbi:MAG: hypothetical protein ACREBW_07705, partial [Candidatus Micrarchaeaceae archaeon]
IDWKQYSNPKNQGYHDYIYNEIHKLQDFMQALAVEYYLAMSRLGDPQPNPDWYSSFLDMLNNKGCQNIGQLTPNNSE